MSANEAPDAQMFLSRLRDHYVDQFLLFVAERRRASAAGGPEVKIEVKAANNQFRGLYCADFVQNDGEPQIVEFEPERILSFNPITASLGNAEIRFEQLRWDDVLIDHDAPADMRQALASWFEKWFDPDDRRYLAGADLGNIIHSLSIEPRQLGIDFGSAAPEAMWELLNLVERAGATELRVTTSRVEADAPKPA